MKKIFVLFLILFLSNPVNIFAVTATPVATASSENIKDSTQNLGEDIQKIREVVKQKVQEKLKDITTTQSNSPQKRSIIGTIIQIDNQQMVVDYQNNTRTITIANDVTIIDLKRNKTKLENLKVGQEVMVMGYLEDNKFTAKRIIFIEIKPLIQKDQIIIGKIADVSKTSPIIVVIPVKNKNSQYQIKVDAKSEIIDRNNNKINSTTLANGQKVIAVIKPESEKSKTYIISKIIILDNLSSSAGKTN